MTQRLVRLIRDDWSAFDGYLASRKVDPLRLAPDRFFSLIYWWATRNASEQAQLDRFDRMLWMPPKGIAAAKGSPWSPEAETAAFASVASALGVVTTGGQKADS